MLNFIILGYVPGTTVQITFTNFITTVALACLVSGAIWYSLSYAVRKKARDIATIQLIAM